MDILKILQEVPDLGKVDFMFVIKGYTVVVLQDGTHEILDIPLRRVENCLSARHFFRIHKSYVINLMKVREVDIRENRLSISMNGQDLPVSRRRKKVFLEAIGAAG